MPKHSQWSLKSGKIRIIWRWCSSFIFFTRKSIEKPILRPREIRRSSLHRTPSLKNRVLKLKWSCLTKSSKSCNIGFEADSLLQRKTFLLRDKIWFVVSFFFLFCSVILLPLCSFFLSFFLRSMFSFIKSCHVVVGVGEEKKSKWTNLKQKFPIFDYRYYSARSSDSRRISQDFGTEKERERERGEHELENERERERARERKRKRADQICNCIYELEIGYR